MEGVNRQNGSIREDLGKGNTIPFISGGKKGGGGGRKGGGICKNRLVEPSVGVTST